VKRLITYLFGICPKITAEFNFERTKGRMGGQWHLRLSCGWNFYVQIFMPASSRWVIAAPKKNLVVGVADMVASNDAGAELVTYSLGSCLGVTVYDPVKKVGGMLHLMLPDSRIDPRKGVTSPFMFVDTGVPQLFKTVFNLGGERFRVIIKVAGGAQFLDEQRTFNIGARNILAFDEMISRNGLAVHARDTGGYNSRTLRFDLATGNVSIHSPGLSAYLL